MNMSDVLKASRERVARFVALHGRNITAVVKSHTGNEPSLLTKLRNLQPFVEPPLTDEEIKTAVLKRAGDMRREAQTIRDQATLLDRVVSGS